MPSKQKGICVRNARWCFAGSATTSAVQAQNPGRNFPLFTGHIMLIMGDAAA